MSKNRSRKIRGITIFKISAIALAALLGVFQLPSPWIERFYSNGVYPWIQSSISSLANSVPFAVMDALIVALIVGLVAWWWVRMARAGRGKRLRAALAMTFNTAVLGAIIFLVFLGLWGFNYSRTPLTKKLDYDEQRITGQALEHRTIALIEEVNRLAPGVHAAPPLLDEDWIQRLLPSFNGVITEFGRTRAIAAVRPKRSLLDAYIAATGTPAFINPFGGEMIADSRLLQIEKPATAAHEWAHLAGYADESEASFVGFLACVRSGDPFVEYSGLLMLYPYLRSNLRRDDVADRLPKLAPEVIEDLKAIAARESERYKPQISRIQWQVYDKFLKASHVKEGVENYGLFVNLLLGAKYEQEWVPVMKPGE